MAKTTEKSAELLYYDHALQSIILNKGKIK